MVIWIFFISAVCTLIYSVIAHGYLHYEAMWAEVILPGVVVWNKLEKKRVQQVCKIYSIFNFLSDFIYIHPRNVSIYSNFTYNLHT